VEEFVLTLGAEAVVFYLILWAGVLRPVSLPAPAREYHFVRLAETPLPLNHVPAPVRLIPVSREEVTELRSFVTETADANKPLPLPSSPAGIPRQLVRTNVFSTGSSALPTLAQAPQNVQTGGFGEPQRCSGERKQRQASHYCLTGIL
jgi:hypothetical protein